MMPTLATRFGRDRVQLTSERPLTDEQLRRVAPSIFADGAHASRSARYSYIPTIEVLRGLRANGFDPYTVAQARTRDEANFGYTKHFLRLRHRSHLGTDQTNEIILLNSHNGSSSYQMLAGVFRYVCANGLICGKTYHDIRVPHKGDARDQVLDGAHVILRSFGLVTEARQRMQATQLTREEARAYGAAALQLRYDGVHTAISPAQAVEPRREQDRRTDLWTVLNVAQENLLRGGQPGRAADGRSVTTRAITAIDQGTALNRALWTLAEEMAKLKSA